MPGARCSQPRARSVVSTRVSHHEFTGITRHSRTRMVLTVSFALLCRALLSPSPADHSADLTPTIEASGPHDFAVRKITRSSVAPPASIASLPYVRDDRETPLCVGRDTNDIEVIWVGSEPEYFCERGWT